MKNVLFLVVLLFALSGMKCNAEVQRDSSAIQSIINELAIEFPSVFNNPEKYELQVRYTQVDLNEQGGIDFNTYDFLVDSLHYFYPASTVKMPLAFLALEKLEMIQQAGYDVNIDTPLRFGKGMLPQTTFREDDTAKDKVITLRHLINRVFAVSDNNAYNRLYEFVGRDDINNILKKKGFFEHSRIITRVGVSGFDYDNNAFANPFEFYDTNGPIYDEIVRRSTKDFRSQELTSEVKGKAYINAEDELIEEAFDMSDKNFISIADLEGALQRVIFPDSFKEEERFKLNDYHLSFLKHAMARLPREHDYPKYDKEKYYDSYVKFFMFGDNTEKIPDHIRIFNKVGYAYGTLTDCAFIVDLRYKIAFFLTATIKVNENETFNDGVYEYEELGIPFLASLGRKIYEYELKREKRKLDLSSFRLKYHQEFSTK